MEKVGRGGRGKEREASNKKNKVKMTISERLY